MALGQQLGGSKVRPISLPADGLIVLIQVKSPILNDEFILVHPFKIDAPRQTNQR
jgi:hypothetical protein